VSKFLARNLKSLKGIGLVVLIAFSSTAYSQWTDDGDGYSSIVLDPSNPDVDIVAEGLDFITYGVWSPIGANGEQEYLEFDVENVTWNRFDINQTGATDADEEAWGWSDGRVDVADVRLFMCMYQNLNDYADINTTGAVIGDPNYGKLDGVVDSADLQFFTDWLADFSSLFDAVSLINEALANGNPCTNRAVDEPQMAPTSPSPKTSVSGTQLLAPPTRIRQFRYILARDALKPASTLDFIVNHYADVNEICNGEPGAQHFDDGYSESDFLASLGSVVTNVTRVWGNRNYIIDEDCLDDGSGVIVGDSTLRTIYRVTFRVGIYLPIDVWWAGIGLPRTVILFQQSGTGCGCP